MYEYIIFDADHTLLDFFADEKAAFERTFQAFDVVYTQADIERAKIISDDVWAEHGLNDLQNERNRNAFHTTYLYHIPFIFERIRQEFFIPERVTNEALADRFVTELNGVSKPLLNGLEVFKELAQAKKCCIATNGLTVMQRARLREFLPYTRGLFISQELGYVKPDKKFFTGMLERLQTSAKNCLFVGDSLTSDVLGCKTVGMDCVWLNVDGRALPEGVSVTGQITNLDELYNYVK